MRQIQRIRFIEELLLATTQGWSRTKWIEYYSDVYQLSRETLSEDLALYNHLLNDYHNSGYVESDKQTKKKYVLYAKHENRYKLKQNAAGIYYTYFNHSQKLVRNDFNQLEYLIQTNRRLFNQNFFNLFRSFRANEEANRNPIPWNPVQLNHVLDHPDENSFGLLLQAIKEKQPVQFTHYNLNPEVKPKMYRVYPLMLKEHSNGWISGWYLLGIVIDNTFPDKIHLKIKNIRLFSLDRINDAVTLNYRPEVIFERRFNPADFFKYTIGLFRINLLQIVTHKKVIVETTGAPTSWIYDYIKAYPIHSTQTVIKDKKENKYLKVSLMVEENPELEQFLMKYSNEIRVVSPVELKTKIKKRLEVALGHYE